MAGTRFTRSMAVAALLSAAACGPKPIRYLDAGEDAGEDAGVDAGRPAGDMPPTGSSRAVEQPDAGAATSRIGVSVSMALDQNEQPMLAFVEEDPNGDGVRQDDRVRFTRWNGVDRAWQPPVTVGTSGQVDDGFPHRQVSLARDAETGRLGVAFTTGATQVKLATSLDEGETWTVEVASAPNPGASAVGDPQLAMAAGSVHLAYWQERLRCAGTGCSAVLYVRRDGAGPGGFSTAEVFPLAAATDANVPMPLSLALDSAGKPGVAAFLGVSSAATVTLAFWRPGSANAASIFDSGTVTDATPSVSVAFDGDLPRVAYHLAGADASVQLRYSAASDAAGATWGASVAIPRNGAVASLETTRYFQALALGAGGKVVIAADFTAATQALQLCGGPKLARSNDGTAFTVCSPDGGKVFGLAGHYVNLALPPSGKLTLAFLYTSTANAQMGPGIVVWREP